MYENSINVHHTLCFTPQILPMHYVLYLIRYMKRVLTQYGLRISSGIVEDDSGHSWTRRVLMYTS